jgi:hypothetical protein
MTWRWVALCAACSIVHDAGAAPFTGAFSGTGRACYGKLFVREKTISWLTTFSQCQKLAYEIVDQHTEGHARRFTFHLKARPKACRYSVIFLRHRADEADLRLGWDVIGYDSLEDYRADEKQGFKGDLPTSMTCYLVAD